MNKLLKQICLSLSAILATMLLFDMTSLDLRFQSLFFDSERQRWFWSGSEPVKRLIFYHLPKIGLIIFALSLIAVLILRKRLQLSKRLTRQLGIVLISLMAVPLTVQQLKAHTNVACPKNLEVFGGNVAYVPLLSTYPPGTRPTHRQHGFPAGHASGGFALMSLCFLFDAADRRRKVLIGALMAGWTMGFYKILIGDHFLSHTLVSMEIGWLAPFSIAYLHAVFQNRRQLGRWAWLGTHHPLSKSAPQENSN